MCGIIGYIGKRKAYPILLEGLKRLEYRGYDSTGMAIVDNDKIRVSKAVGKVSNLEKKLSQKNIEGNLGIAHTRWATHGKPDDKNSHPHQDCSGRISLVHNGIIENYLELKKELEKKGHKFRSETDSEVVAHQIEEFKKMMNYEEAIKSTLKKIKGTFGLAIINEKEPDKIVVARNGSPLVLGVGKDEYLIASDVSAIINHTRRVVYLDDGELAIITRDGFEIKNVKNKIQNKAINTLDWSMEKAEKQGYTHFMLKEIFEQPMAIEDAIRGRLLEKEGMARLGGLSNISKDLKKIEKIFIVSCGTSYYAGLVGKYMLEEYAGIPAQVEYASEFRYRTPILDKKTAVIAISQSGETADTLAAIREAKKRGAITIGIINTVGSTIARETDAGTYNHAGPEIGVASTKAFTSQLSILVLLTLYLGRQRKMSLSTGKKIAKEMKKVSKLIKIILSQEKEIKKIAKKYFKYENFLYLGRKYNFPIACEGALKIKEISYVHAEGYPTGEMKHGPIALIDKDFPSIFIVPKDSVYEKNISGMQEIRARGGKIIAIATEGDKGIEKNADDVIYIPKTLEMFNPILTVIPLQLLAYHVGVARNLDVDKPRNLAKSVTVE